MENKNPIQVADRLFLVLETLAETGPAALADLCRHLELNKSTVHRLLSSLIYMGYVKQDAETGKYALSFKLLTLSNKLMSHMDILETVRPFLKKLRKPERRFTSYNWTVWMPCIFTKRNPTRIPSAWFPRWAAGFPFTVPVWEKPWPRTCRKPKSKKSGTTAKSRN